MKEEVKSYLKSLDTPNLIAVSIIAVGCMIYNNLFFGKIEDRLDKRISAQELRSDKLYESLQRSTEQLSAYRKESDDKFYAMLREKK